MATPAPSSDAFDEAKSPGKSKAESEHDATGPHYEEAMVRKIAEVMDRYSSRAIRDVLLIHLRNVGEVKKNAEIWACHPSKMRGRKGQKFNYPSDKMLIRLADRQPEHVAWGQDIQVVHADMGKLNAITHRRWAGDKECIRGILQDLTEARRLSEELARKSSKSNLALLIANEAMLAYARQLMEFSGLLKSKDPASTVLHSTISVPRPNLSSLSRTFQKYVNLWLFHTAPNRVTDPRPPLDELWRNVDTIVTEVSKCV